jgi:hypothetical protein
MNIYETYLNDYDIDEPYKVFLKNRNDEIDAKHKIDEMYKYELLCKVRNQKNRNQQFSIDIESHD